MKSIKNEKNVGRVYSTEWGKICPACGKPSSECLCQKSKPAPAGDGIVRVRRETQGRKGKGVTLITGLPLEPETLKTLGKILKTQFGSGGTVKDGVIEIQGDHRGKSIALLKKEGWT